jgi:hypothetical protein
MLAVPLMLPAVAGTKSIASVQAVPGAKVDGGEFTLNCGQLLLLSCVKLVEILEATSSLDFSAMSRSDQGSPDWLVLDRGSACTRSYSTSLVSSDIVP